VQDTTITNLIELAAVFDDGTQHHVPVSATYRQIGRLIDDVVVTFEIVMVPTGPAANGVAANPGGTCKVCSLYGTRSERSVTMGPLFSDGRSAGSK
jgi:streptogramin lyase